VAAALFERQQSLGEPLFSQLPRELGLDQDQLSTCIKGDAAERVRADVVLAQNLEISGTPTFLIGVMQSDHRMKTTALMKGFPPLSGFRQALDDALKPKWYSGWTAPAVAAFLGLISVAAFFRVSRRRRLQPA
jgi:predicted DsbA family dithiol-disulfide isomerase